MTLINSYESDGVEIITAAEYAANHKRKEESGELSGRAAKRQRIVEPDFFGNDAPPEVLGLIGQYAAAPSYEGYDVLDYQGVAPYIASLPQNIAEKVFDNIQRETFDHSRVVSGLLKYYCIDFPKMPEAVRTIFGFESVRQKMEVLYFSVFSITEPRLEETLKMAQQFPQMNAIDISGGHNRGINDRSVELVAQYRPNLRTIWLTDNGPHVTDRAINALLPLPELKEVHLRNVYMVSAGAKARLRERGVQVIES